MHARPLTWAVSDTYSMVSPPDVVVHTILRRMLSDRAFDALMRLAEKGLG